jgi:hypothetical protein
VIDPFAKPLQVAFTAVIVAAKMSGSVIVAAVVVSQPLASFTVIVYEPAANDPNVAVAL